MLQMRLSTIIVALALGASACTTPVGLLYTDITMPYVTNMNATPLGKKKDEHDMKQIKDPIFTGFSVNWDSNAIGDIMTRNKFAKGYFADLQTFSVLLGIFGSQAVVVSGD